MKRSNWQDVHGVLVLDKPEGLSSNGALQRVRRLLKARKAGHTGSLDPLATGVLPICLGEATKYSHFLLDADKAYDAQGRLGECRDTGDVQGELLKSFCPDEWPLRSAVEAACEAMVGELDQVPPMFSALKVGGKRLYELARAGKEVERKARRIRIASLVLQQWEPPAFSLSVQCSKGTYVRTLLEDLAQEVGQLACMSGLRRTQSGPFSLAQSITLEALETLCEGVEVPQEVLREAGVLRPVDASVRDLPERHLEKSELGSIICGQAVTITGLKNLEQYRIYSPEGLFAGVAKAEEGVLKPARLISQSWLEQADPGLKS